MARRRRMFPILRKRKPRSSNQSPASSPASSPAPSPKPAPLFGSGTIADPVQSPEDNVPDSTSTNTDTISERAHDEQNIAFDQTWPPGGGPAWRGESHPREPGVPSREEFRFYNDPEYRTKTINEIANNLGLNNQEIPHPPNNAFNPNVDPITYHGADAREPRPRQPGQPHSPAVDPPLPGDRTGPYPAAGGERQISSRDLPARTEGEPQAGDRPLTSDGSQHITPEMGMLPGDLDEVLIQEGKDAVETAVDAAKNAPGAISNIASSVGQTISDIVNKAGSAVKDAAFPSWDEHPHRQEYYDAMTLYHEQKYGPDWRKKMLRDKRLYKSGASPGGWRPGENIYADFIRMQDVDGDGKLSTSEKLRGLQLTRQQRPGRTPTPIDGVSGVGESPNRDNWGIEQVPGSAREKPIMEKPEPTDMSLTMSRTGQPIFRPRQDSVILTRPGLHATATPGRPQEAYEPTRESMQERYGYDKSTERFDPNKVPEGYMDVTEPATNRFWEEADKFTEGTDKRFTEKWLNDYDLDSDGELDEEELMRAYEINRGRYEQEVADIDLDNERRAKKEEIDNANFRAQERIDAAEMTLAEHSEKVRKAEAEKRYGEQRGVNPSGFNRPERQEGFYEHQSNATAAQSRGSRSRNHTWHVDGDRGGALTPNVRLLTKTTGMSYPQAIRVQHAFRDGNHPREAYSHLTRPRADGGLGYTMEQMINPQTGRPYAGDDKPPQGMSIQDFSKMVNDVHHELLRYHVQTSPSKDQIGSTSGHTYEEIAQR